MNLLPFVMIIIMTLGLFTLSQFQKSVTQKKEKQIYLSYFEGLRKTRVKKATAAYERQRIRPFPKKPPDKPSKKTKKPKQEREYFRTERIGWDKGRLNLSFLIEEPHKYPALEAIAIEYINKLYRNATFFPKRGDPAKAILEALIKAYKNEKDSTPFHQLELSDPKLQTLFYKMMKGTHTYDLNKLGYPPFSEMFTFEKKDIKPIHYNYANAAFLSIILDEEGAKEWMAREKKALMDRKKNSPDPIIKKEFIKFVKNQKGAATDAIIALFDFNPAQSKHRPAKYQDAKTKITVKAL